jgi:hypothetical protein
MGPSALHETGHFYFAQTGHSHFAATPVDEFVVVRAEDAYDAQASVLNREFRLESPGLGEKSKPRGKQYGVQEKVIDLQVAEASLLEVCEALEEGGRHRSGQWRSK